VAAAARIVGQAVEQLEPWRIVEAPEAAEAHERAALPGRRAPQPVAVGRERGGAGVDERPRPLVRDHFIVEKIAPHARLGEQRVQAIEITSDERTQAETRGTDLGHPWGPSLLGPRHAFNACTNASVNAVAVVRLSVSFTPTRKRPSCAGPRSTPLASRRVRNASGSTPRACTRNRLVPSGILSIVKRSCRCSFAIHSSDAVTARV